MTHSACLTARLAVAVIALLPVSSGRAQSRVSDPSPGDPVDAIIRAFDQKSLVGLAEAHTLQVIMTHAFVERDADLENRLKAWKAPAMARLEGTWHGIADRVGANAGVLCCEP